MAKKEKRFTEQLRCNHCGNQAPMEIVAEYSQVSPHVDEKMTVQWDEGDVFELLSCPVCSRVTLRQYYYHAALDPDGTGEPQVLYPLGKDVPLGLPPTISRAYEAATRVRSIDPNAYSVLLRRLLELVCIDRKAEGGTLNDQLESLARTGEIPQKLVGVSHSIRQLGNVGAHASLGELTPAELPVLDGLCKAVLEYVYSAPFLVGQAEGRLSKLQGARRKRRRGKGA